VFAEDVSRMQVLVKGNEAGEDLLVRQVGRPAVGFSDQRIDGIPSQSARSGSMMVGPISRSTYARSV
jgi:hypothetical protein